MLFRSRAESSRPAQPGGHRARGPRSNWQPGPGGQRERERGWRRAEVSLRSSPEGNGSGEPQSGVPDRDSTNQEHTRIHHDTSNQARVAPLPGSHRSSTGELDRGGEKSATVGMRTETNPRGEKGWGGSRAHPGHDGDDSEGGGAPQRRQWRRRWSAGSEEEGGGTGDSGDPRPKNKLSNSWLKSNQP